MNYFEQFKNEIETEGFRVVKTTFDSGLSIYEIISEETDGFKRVSGQVSKKVADMLAAATGTEIIKAPGKACAVNYKPETLTGDQVAVFKAAGLIADRQFRDYQYRRAQ